ncbi:hypothetical protein G6028_00260 [Dietzia cercidiphylli]|uniref:Uncharacterized protein n=1 Tax=Dietzia cercidiphylli TaxID=498199 RepID=A0ABN2I630_9ACTN|nr:hypothetical protein [Dietzia cercidiphylli]
MGSLAALGLADDKWGLPATFRLAAQASIGGALGLAIGGSTSALVGALALPTIVNAVNFMDGVNGITCATAAAWGFSRLLKMDQSSAAPSAIALGSSLGFAPWNVPRAKMFLGDAGSYYFGGIVAATALASFSRSGTRGLFESLSPLGFYLVDTGTTMARRAYRGEKLMEAHRSHAYQRLADREGWEHWHVAALAGVVALTSGLSSTTMLGAARALVPALCLSALPDLLQYAEELSDIRPERLT